MTNNAVARAAGLTTLNHIETVRTLAGGPEIMTTIAVSLGISTAATTHLADKLERLGLIERHRGTTDRRSVWLKLTPSGQSLAARFQSETAAS